MRIQRCQKLYMLLQKNTRQTHLQGGLSLDIRSVKSVAQSESYTEVESLVRID